MVNRILPHVYRAIFPDRRSHMAEMKFVLSMSPICPIITESRIQVVRVVSWMLYLLITAMFVTRLLLESSGDTSDLLHFILEYSSLAESVFAAWSFIATDPVRIYCIYCVTKFTNAKKKQTDELIRYLHLVRKYSAMNFAS